MLLARAMPPFLPSGFAARPYDCWAASAVSRSASTARSCVFMRSRRAYGATKRSRPGSRSLGPPSVVHDTRPKVDIRTTFPHSVSSLRARATIMVLRTASAVLSGSTSEAKKACARRPPSLPHRQGGGPAGGDCLCEPTGGPRPLDAEPLGRCHRQAHRSPNNLRA
jgi:hypothetical protein